MNGLKFKYLFFKKIEEEYKGIAVWIDGKEISCGSIVDVLTDLSKLDNPHDTPDYEIAKT